MESTTRSLEGRKQIQRVTGEYNGESFLLFVDMAVLTSEWFKALGEATEIDVIAGMFADAIEEWDVSMDGTPFPPTVENLMEVPGDFWRSILAALSAAALSNATLELSDEIKKAEGTARFH